MRSVPCPGLRVPKRKQQLRPPRTTIDQRQRQLIQPDGFLVCELG